MIVEALFPHVETSPVTLAVFHCTHLDYVAAVEYDEQETGCWQYSAWKDDSPRSDSTCKSRGGFSRPAPQDISLVPDAPRSEVPPKRSRKSRT
jgi:hypothetical protein